MFIQIGKYNYIDKSNMKEWNCVEQNWKRNMQTTTKP